MAKYNEFENDDYLLTTNLLGMTNFAELEQAEAFTFLIRATQIEQGAYNIMAFSLTNFVGLHRHLFQDIYSFAGQFRDVQLMKVIRASAKYNTWMHTRLIYSLN